MLRDRDTQDATRPLGGDHGAGRREGSERPGQFGDAREAIFAIFAEASKDGGIELQGDHLAKAETVLKSLGYKTQRR